MTRDCPECGASMLAFPVEPALREYLPGDDPGAALCPRCLTLRPVADPPAEVPDFGRVSDAYPDGSSTAVPFALLLGLLSSLAIHRDEIAALLELVERGGTDPLLALDRLADDPDVESDVDLGGRRRQLEQLL
ncbi:DUF6276 family protein [Halomicrobium salinisoli]|uniref:DUF6276 family protein n=1 Tax=Halomicrobium salinisoli TaxID=2878391 RepID=UPI001CEFE75F|nr:DUF6276 family protein [Halomicrobium salinisoli]